MHGGSVALESRPNTGTKVTISLPASEPKDVRVNEPAFEFDYAGGFSHLLLELSDLLPHEAFSRAGKNNAGQPSADEKE
jgi:hypothetical protein